jgi:2-polyprenyl-3-methyl-5-hydroxy-6-metoxy-1,4-benzoquinol methylase
MSMDKAGKEFWEASWAASRPPDSVDPLRQGLTSYVHGRFDKYFRKVFAGAETRRAKLIEIGCARSLWLPFFATEFGFEVTGLDYSERGCQQEREILARAGVEGEVVCADFFSPPESLLGSFDVVVSLGVAEHFTDTPDCIKAFARFLKPGGLMLTSIPNMKGLPGLLARRFNRAFYDVHVPLDAQALAGAHAAAGLNVLECDNFMSSNFGVCSLEGIKERSAEWLAKKSILALLVRLSWLAWIVEDKTGGQLKPNRLTSPYINCVARKQL